MAKRIELKTTQAEDNTAWDYRKVIMDNLKIKQGGFDDIEEIEKALTIRQKVRDANGAVILDDAEQHYLVERFKQVKWVIADQVIVDFMNDLKNAPTVDVSKLT